MEHDGFGATLGNLALTYHQAGRLGKAEPLYKCSLAIRKKARGANHMVVAVGMENYADLLVKIGRVEEAKPLEARAAAIRGAYWKR